VFVNVCKPDRKTDFIHFFSVYFNAALKGDREGQGGGGGGLDNKMEKMVFGDFH
jgi:hypothetical protein